MKNLLLLILGVSLFTSCKKTIISPPVTYKGIWQAGSFVVKDSSVTLDVSNIILKLNEDSRYSFVNNIGQNEAGVYVVRDSLLVVTDTTVSPSVEKAMQITGLTSDSLVLRMNFGGKESWMHFTKQKESK
ncbi:MAG: hypothetical protein KDC31_01695 [Saprospiraceae bacterium]|jgi:hypothetical protein|nr:hypothetical protein [Candidatus Parvibacillus calidus]MBX2936731.1 hypothetical protein [Saprospiraceae bacterium]MBX7178476.1 hypothetical protein [Saprospiraceae bacterium]MCB0589982.1 hypothetical protein [Saprospiraceae bacterium]MCO5282780.1 hypothetical protein [Saprospiraceae bacterium]